MGDLEVLDADTNPALLGSQNPGVVMVGLNSSRAFPDVPFRNFHDPSAVAKDFKIRFACRDTVFWGAYMTDVIKDFVEPVSERLLDHLRANPQFVRAHMDTLRAELADLVHPRPAVLAFGHTVHDLLNKHLRPYEYLHLVPNTHNSHRISKEKYRDTVRAQIHEDNKRSGLEKGKLR
jgi:hypothetical protein